MKTKTTENIIKRRLIFLFLAGSTIFILQQPASGQENPPPPPPPPPAQQKPMPELKLPVYIVLDNDTIYQMTEENAQFPGGTQAMEGFRERNQVYPPELQALGIRGSVTVSFIVGEDGSISKAAVGRGVSPTLDAEALRVTALMPKWIPGKEKGRPVKFTRSMTYVFGVSPRTFQYENEEDKGVYVVVEQMPKFPGGDAALLKYIATNVKYPEAAKNDGIQGRVIIRFCVTENGGIDLVSVLRGVDPELDAEAVRVIKTLPSFEPGKQGGIAVPVWYSVPITFALNPSAGVPMNLKTSGYNTPPSYPGGETALYGYVRSKLIYPPSARQNMKSGKVIVNFCITPEGKTDCVSVYKGVDPDLDAEAVRVISSISGWQPAKLNGNPVSVYYQMPVMFTLKQ